MKSAILSAAACLAASLSFAGLAQGDELIQNGGFETGPQYRADFWTIPDLGTDPNSGEPNNYARVGNFVNQVGIDEYGYSYGPHGAGNGTGTQIPTRTVWMGGLSPRTSIIEQAVDTSGYEGGTATLTFKVVHEDVDVAGADFFTVDFGGVNLLTIDVGAAWEGFVNQFGVPRDGGLHFWTVETPEIDLSPYLDGTTKNLTFTMINDATPNTISSAWLDNVSITAAAAIPEPATAGLAASAGLLLLARRRR